MVEFAVQSRALFADKRAVEQVHVDIDLGRAVEALFVLWEFQERRQDSGMSFLLSFGHVFCSNGELGWMWGEWGGCSISASTSREAYRVYLWTRPNSTDNTMRKGEGRREWTDGERKRERDVCV